VKRLLQLAVSLSISGAALWLMLRGKDLSAIAGAARAADHRYLVGYLLILALIHYVRTARWGLLLEPVARVPFAKLNSVCAVGFMALFLLPLRLGEFARPYLVADRPRLRVSAALSSVVVERVVDGVFAAALLVLTLLAIPEGTANLRLFRGAGWIMMAVFGGLVLFLVVAYLNRDLAVRFTRRLLGPLSDRLADRLAGMMDAFIHGLRLVPSRKKLLLFFGLTLLYWGLNGWGMQLLARGFGIALSPVQAYTVLGVLLAGVMIPAGPGMVGTFQYAVVMGLSLFVPPSVADVRGQAYANVLWAAQLAQLTAFGLFHLFSRHIQLVRIFRAPAEVEEGLEEEEAEYQAEARSGEGPGVRRSGA
jgi:glycosyltransferase 2 family protein